MHSECNVREKQRNSHKHIGKLGHFRTFLVHSTHTEIEKQPFVLQFYI